MIRKRTRRILAAFLLSTLTWTSSSRAGNEVAHGGAGIWCTRSSLNAFWGFYSLDFIVMRGGILASDSAPFAAATFTAGDYTQILEWLQGRMNQKLPGLGKKFANFQNHLFQDVATAPRRWQNVPWVDRTFDQALGRHWKDANTEVDFRSLPLPLNCRPRTIVNVAARLKHENQLVYIYNSKLTRALAHQSPMQLSFLIVHEWLRDFTNDAEKIRRANRLLHSNAMNNWTGAELRAKLHEMGIFW